MGMRRTATIAAVVMLIAILVSALGTHHRIGALAQPPPRAQKSLLSAVGEVLETLRDKSFLALFISTIAGAAASGLTAALAFLMLTYFWGFSSEEIYYWTALVVVSAVLGLMIAPWASKRWGKKNAAIRLGVIGIYSLQPLPGGVPTHSGGCRRTVTRCCFPS